MSSMPSELLDQSDGVFLGELVYSRTISWLGHSESMEADFDNYLIEYAFRPVNIIKGNSEDSLVSFWFPASLCWQTNYRSDLPLLNHGVHLVYGQRLVNEEDIPKVASSWETQRARIDNFSSELIQLLENNDSLKAYFANRVDKHAVFYGTEFLMSTMFDYEKGMIYCCPDSTGKVYSFTSEEYVDELIRLETLRRK